MTKKIYISPSDQTENRYAWGNTNEHAQCQRIAEAEAAALRRSGVEVKLAPSAPPWPSAAPSPTPGARTSTAASTPTPLTARCPAPGCFATVSPARGMMHAGLCLASWPR